MWRFPATERMSTYVTAIVAGEYHQVHDTYVGKHGEIPLGHYCRQSMVPHFDTDELVEVTKQGFAFFEDAFDFPYPFHKYDQLYVPEFNNGAMENAGCVTLRDEYLPRSRQATWFYEQRANTVLHEMAHMWFGDLVTMKWWDDLWLNESFAEWASHHALVEATKYDEAWTGFTNARKNWAYRQDQLPSTHPIAADNHDLEAVEVSFDGITYAKGASALKQLVAWVGEQESFAGLKAYFRRHAFGNSEFQDLLSALEETSGRDLQSWAEEWLQTSGVNTLSVDATVDEDGRYVSFAVVQSAHPDHPTLRRHRIGVGLYDRAEDGRLVRRTTVETDVVGARTEVAKLVGTTAAGPGAAQRRRPVLREDPLRRAVAGDRARVDPPHRGLAGPGAVLGRAVGHDPRRRALRRRLRRAGPAGPARRVRRDRGQAAAGLRADRHRPVLAPVQARRAAGDLGEGPARR